MKSRVHPKYKTQYRVGNWAEYDRALVRRGDVTLWLTPDAIATWAAAGVGRRSGHLQYSDLAIETALTLSLIFHVPLRQTEGVLTSIFGMLGVDRTAPDHTTLSRRGQHLARALRRARPGTSLHLIVDSTGLSIVGAGEWAAATQGGRGRRGWRKLHLGVDGSRVIVAGALTEPTAEDAITGISLVDEVDGHLTRVTADPAYDTLAFYGAAGARGARVVVPPTKGASVIKCCYAATGMYVTAAAALLRGLANTRTTLSHQTTRRRDTKMSRSVSRRVASPACIAGVRVSRPNFSAPCGRTKL